ncbi:uncharacterized protein PV09_07770 [Verruconis gallopava]|uniref:Amino acid transporter transmembrane domain-containing protein n=1 Tax=Verruconis gallopava TaxID=253628 RepID=A0A0D1XF06_9PEZI|nr:uncharacterized protein PV09_07770 [Verruconis gallopava]KIW00791.1 hypothetical protein PV09_07770 [Verruconis gallopava]
MSTNPGKQPSTWRTRPEQNLVRDSSFSSTGSGQAVHFDEDAQDNVSRTVSHSNLAVPNDGIQDGDLRRRRSSMALRLESFMHAGGVNSIDRFASSWQRAAGFFEITPVRPSFRFADDTDGEPSYTRRDIEHSPDEARSLLREAFHDGGRRGSDNALDDSGVGTSPGGNETSLARRLSMQRRRYSREESLFSVEPSLDSPFGGSYGTQYGSVTSKLNRSSIRHAAQLFNEQQAKGITEPDKEREPLLVKTVEEDGVAYNVVVGQSTLPQTVFNSVNVLIGVGLLSLPLAIHYSGWVVGMLFYLFAVISTQYTAKLLAKCLDVDSSLITFADLAYVSFGQGARVVVSILFTLELLGANVALIVLFADSLDDLIPGLGVVAWKIIAAFILVPLAFLPLRLLSFTSVLGILSCFGIVICVFIDGLIKPQQPGSLRQPATQYLFPINWTTIPLSLGLLMSPWGGHSVFPNIYRDMRHPYKYRRGVDITYAFTFLLDLGMAVIGILMFGDAVRDEITSNILTTAGYPKAISFIIVICIAIIPLTKVPLNARPIVSTIEILAGLDARALAQSNSLVGMSGFNRGLLKATIRILTVLIFVGIAIVFPSFDRIMTLLGSVCCFTICIILPLAFHLKLFSSEIGRAEKALNWVLIVISSIMAIVSTVFACLPKDLIGA